MTMKGAPRVVARCVFCVAAVLQGPALAAEGNEPPKPGSLPGDQDRLGGDHLTLRTNAYGFKDPSSKQADKCAPQGSTLRVIQELDGMLTVQFRDIPDKPRGVLGTPEVTQAALDACKDRVNTYTAYQISRTALEG